MDIPNNVTQFIENELKGRIVTTHPDGPCVRRAIGKIWNLHPGQVIKYMGEKCKKLMEQNIMTEWENEVEWYQTMANRPKEWEEIKNNVPQQCKRNEWGGSSEIKIWAMITKTIMIEINADNNTVNIFYPEINNTVGIHLSTQRKS